MTQHGEVVLDDRPCLACGYNLRSLPTTGKCPECGAPVERSLRGVLLRYSSPTYLARLRRGILLVEVAIGLQILYKVGFIIFGFALAVYSMSSGLAFRGWSTGDTRFWTSGWPDSVCTRPATAATNGDWSTVAVCDWTRTLSRAGILKLPPS